MDIASIFDWFARESMHAAGETSDLIQREMWARLALMWAAAAQCNGSEEVIAQAMLSRHETVASS